MYKKPLIFAKPDIRQDLQKIQIILVGATLCVFGLSMWQGVLVDVYGWAYQTLASFLAGLIAFVCFEVGFFIGFILSGAFLIFMLAMFYLSEKTIQEAGQYVKTILTPLIRVVSLLSLSFLDSGFSNLPLKFVRNAKYFRLNKLPYLLFPLSCIQLE